jgi:hypothetical protein
MIPLLPNETAWCLLVTNIVCAVFNGAFAFLPRPA